MREDFNRLMRELKGPDWVDTADKPRALKAADEIRAIEYSGGADQNSIEELGRNIAMNQFVKTGHVGDAPLAIANAPEVKIETAFEGTTGEIKLEDVIMMDPNGNPVGTMVPEGNVLNPMSNPVYAAMYTPYLASYNYMAQNPNAYFASMPQGNLDIIK